MLSWKRYYQVDCKYFRLKVIYQVNYTGQMGTGSIYETYSEPEKEWRYPPPDSIMEEYSEKIFNYVCK